MYFNYLISIWGEANAVALKSTKTKTQLPKELTTDDKPKWHIDNFGKGLGMIQLPVPAM